MKWFFEPGHTAAEFKARHMMVTWVRGQFKNVPGELEFDPSDLTKTKIDVVIKTDSLWTGEPTRDAHLRSADFLDVEHYPTMEFHSKSVKVIGEVDFQVTGALTIRGITRDVVLDVTYLGQWETPWWEDGVNKGPRLRAGFTACTRINRHDFEVNWNDVMPRGGVVVGDYVELTIDAEAVRAS
jgi:polyisoprenoid-binding protein YceI